MSIAREVLDIVGAISEQDDAAANMDATLSGAAEGDDGKLANELIGYLNDLFDGDFAVVTSTFDDTAYRLSVEFSPELPADADVSGIAADLADIFGATEADVIVDPSTITVENMFQDETDEAMIPAHTETHNGKTIKVPARMAKKASKGMLAAAKKRKGKKLKRSAKGKASFAKSMAKRAQMK